MRKGFVLLWQLKMKVLCYVSYDLVLVSGSLTIKAMTLEMITGVNEGVPVVVAAADEDSANGSDDGVLDSHGA